MTMSRKRITVDYDAATGNIIDATGFCQHVAYNLEIVSFEKDTNAKTSIEDLVTLKNAGYTTEDIIELKRKEII